jgi:hypothetical protein
MAEQRTKRAAQAREVEQRPSDSWKPASVLPTPDPQDGWVFRWVRTSTLGKSDNTNVSQKFREGWTPVRAEDHPELEVMSDIGSRFEGNIEVGGLLLCKAPENEVKKREEYFERMAETQMESVDNNFLRENDPRMPVLSPERSSRTTFGRG